jgi:hypothetical protein
MSEMVADLGQDEELGLSTKAVEAPAYLTCGPAPVGAELRQNVMAITSRQRGM